MNFGVGSRDDDDPYIYAHESDFPIMEEFSGAKGYSLSRLLDNVQVAFSSPPSSKSKLFIVEILSISDFFERVAIGPRTAAEPNY